MANNNELLGVLITNTDKECSIKQITFIDTLKVLYRLVNCDLVEMPVRYINGVPYTFIIDEEGLLKDNQKISAISYGGIEYLVGNILIVKGEPTDDGELVGLDDKDVSRIFKAFDMVDFILRYDFQ